MSDVKVWTENKRGRDGLEYSVRYLLDSEEIKGLQGAGLISMDIAEVIGMQRVADTILADFEKQLYTAAGGVVQ